MGSFSSLRWDVFLTKPQENKDRNSHFCNKGTSERLCRGWACERLCAQKKTKNLHMHYLLPACVPLLFTAQTKLKAHVREFSLMRKRPLLSPCFFLTSFLVSPLCHHLASATGQLFWVMQVQFLWLKEQNLPKPFVKLCINITCQITNLKKKVAYMWLEAISKKKKKKSTSRH